MRLSIVLLALALSALPAAQAQQFPSRPVTIVVPSGSGGPLDLLARLVAQRVAPRLGQSVLVENRAGAGGWVGAEQVLRAPADGHIWLCQAFNGLHSDLFNKEQPVALTRELAPIAGLAETPNIFVVPASLPARTLPEFIAHVKANPKKFNIAVFLNTANHLESISLLRTHGLDMTIVPYNASSALQIAMLRDEIQLYITSPTAWLPHIEAGKLRAVATAAAQRLPQLPAVATVREQGLGDYRSGVFFAMLVSAKTPPALLRTLHAHIAAAMDVPEVHETLAKAGLFVPEPASVEQLAARLESEAKTLRGVAKSAGIEPK